MLQIISLSLHFLRNKLLINILLKTVRKRFFNKKNAINNVIARHLG